jgi:hypothetical protein
MGRSRLTKKGEVIGGKRADIKSGAANVKVILDGRESSKYPLLRIYRGPKR